MSEKKPNGRSVVGDINSPVVLFLKASALSVIWLGLNLAFVEIFSPDLSSERWFTWVINLSWFTLIILIELRFSTLLQHEFGNHFMRLPRIIHSITVISAYCAFIILFLSMFCQWVRTADWPPEWFISSDFRSGLLICGLFFTFVVRASSFVYHVEVESNEA